MINKFIIIILIMQFISCSEKNDKKQESSQYDYQSELKRKIISNGDKKAYDSLSFIYMKDSNSTDLLAYSMIMAHDYNYPHAYYDVFDILYSTGYYKENSDSCFDYNLQCMGEETKKIALKYLKLGIQKGDIASSTLLLNFYNKGKYYPIEELYTDEKLVEKAKLNLKSSE